MIFDNTRRLEPEVMASPEDVAAYDRLTVKYLRILHYGFVETIINSAPESGRFLEIGCGTGRISLGLARFTRDIHITAVDRSDTMLSVARGIAARNNMARRIMFRHADSRALPYGDHSFDAVFSHNMLHHLEDPMPVLREMKRVLKPSGAFLVRDLIRQSPVRAWTHTWGFGLTYSRLMKNEYYSSMRAAYSKEEFMEMIDRLGLSGCRYRRQFITHHGMERSAANSRRDRVVIPSSRFVSWLKRRYSSRPDTDALK